MTIGGYRRLGDFGCFIAEINVADDELAGGVY